jgi:pimeloyl-ACP methyl ester carboxylesterase
VAGLAESALVFDLKQVRRYLTDSALREAARDRVRALIGPDTTVVVAHSLGTVVAYEALCSLPGHPVRELVTLGSPLGIRNLIFDGLLPPPTAGLASWPDTPATRWTNIADARDVVALVEDLRPRFGPDVSCTGAERVTGRTTPPRQPPTLAPHGSRRLLLAFAVLLLSLSGARPQKTRRRGPRPHDAKVKPRLDVVVDYKARAQVAFPRSSERADSSR